MQSELFSRVSLDQDTASHNSKSEVNITNLWEIHKIQRQVLSKERRRKKQWLIWHSSSRRPKSRDRQSQVSDPYSLRHNSTYKSDSEF